MRTLPWLLLAALLILLFTGVCIVKPPTPALRATVAASQLDQFAIALEAHRQDTNDYPSAGAGLQALRTNPGVHGWDGPYLPQDIPLDPWGKPYRYQRLPTGDAEISTTGPVPPKTLKRLPNP